ncbi:MAG: hypothetical protein QNJ38_01095 [Prochloraceae cyanobacterium]|nr:hypothetical protein [Prochloraceae cyanobacterium]
MTAAEPKYPEDESLKIIKLPEENGYRDNLNTSGFTGEAPLVENPKLTQRRQELRQEEEFKHQRMEEVHLLLENLAKREEVAIKMIVERLYDVGKLNFIDKKVRSPRLNKFLKKLLSLPKPLAVRVAFFWFTRNCPRLIVDWLEGKLKFKKD